MPIYDYQCTACDHRTEVVHGLNETGPAACTLCGGKMRKLFAPPSIHFKGTGWAKKERGASNATKASKSSGSSDSGGSSSAGESGGPGGSGGSDTSGSSGSAGADAKSAGSPSSGD